MGPSVISGIGSGIIIEKSVPSIGLGVSVPVLMESISNNCDGINDSISETNHCKSEINSI